MGVFAHRGIILGGGVNAPVGLALVGPEELCNLGLLLFPEGLDSFEFEVEVFEGVVVVLGDGFEGCLVQPEPTVAPLFPLRLQLHRMVKVVLLLLLVDFDVLV